MANAKQLADFNRRSAGSPAPVVPIKELPKAAETLSVFARSPERRAALKKQDEENEEWRKSLSFSVSNASASAVAAKSTVAATAAAPSPTIPSTLPPIPPLQGKKGDIGPQGLPGLSEVLAVRCPDNGKVYRYVAVEGDEGVTTGQWEVFDGEPSLRYVPRTGDGGIVTGEWQPASVRNPDDGLSYHYVPRLADDGETIAGQWQEV